MTARQLITLTALIAAPIALVSLGDKPKANANAQPVQVVESLAATAPQQEQVSNEARTASPAPATAAPCQCDPTLQARLQELELEHAALAGRYYELAAKVEQLQQKAVAKSATTQPAATIRNYRIVQPQASGYCVGGNCSTSRGRVGIFGRRR
jgi:hypothetical protein